jgi:hypothetical protein
MSLLYYFLIGAGSLAAMYAMFRFVRAARVYLTFRGQRLVSCPENHRPAAVRVAAGEAALKTMVGTQQLRLSTCSRWPEREACGQECLAQIEEAPKACLVWTIIRGWYQGQVCVYCHKPFGEIHWHDHPPALLNGERKTVQWNEIPPTSCSKPWEHTGPSAGAATWPKPFGANIPNWWWTGPRTGNA